MPTTLLTNWPCTKSPILSTTAICSIDNSTHKSSGANSCSSGFRLSWKGSNRRAFSLRSMTNRKECSSKNFTSSGLKKPKNSQSCPSKCLIKSSQISTVNSNASRTSTNVYKRLSPPKSNYSKKLPATKLSTHSSGKVT